MEEFKEGFSEIIENNQNDNERRMDCTLNCNEIDNSSNTIYGETVLCSYEQLLNLPECALNFYQQYSAGELAPVTKEEVQDLLHKWFHNEPISQLPTIPDVSDPGQLPSELSKRRRVTCDL